MVVFFSYNFLSPPDYLPQYLTQFQVHVRFNYCSSEEFISNYPTMLNLTFSYFALWKQKTVSLACSVLTSVQGLDTNLS